MKITVGLGNPGKQYVLTRHNVGFMVVNAIAKNSNETWQYNKKFNAEITSLPAPLLIRRGEKGERFILAKPQTLMNNSGQALRALMSYYQLLPKKLSIFTAKGSDLSNILTIIHDDIDIELGKYKISVDSRSAGHKGVQSIINHLKTKNFKRIRIGIRTTAADKIPAEKFVLQKFSEEEINIIRALINEIIK
jgi:PTH1 family peptidyl-tRNA hydrolase